MKFLKWIGISTAVLAALIGSIAGGILLYAPYHDGPIAMFPGGALASGELISEKVTNWSFVAPIESIEMQLTADDNRSRTTWVLYHGDSAYIPVTLGFPPGKNWHHLAAGQGDAVVRISGKRYPVTLAKVEEKDTIATMNLVNRAKYPPAPGSDQGSWYFLLQQP
jgi:hypothetical protein